MRRPAKSARFTAAAAAADLAGANVDVDGITIDAHVFEETVCDLRCSRALECLEVRLLGNGLQARDREQADAEHDQRDQQFQQREAMCIAVPGGHVRSP